MHFLLFSEKSCSVNENCHIMFIIHCRVFCCQLQICIMRLGINYVDHVASSNTPTVLQPFTFSSPRPLSPRPLLTMYDPNLNCVNYISRISTCRSCARCRHTRTRQMSGWSCSNISTTDRSSSSIHRIQMAAQYSVRTTDRLSSSIHRIQLAAQYSVRTTARLSSSIHRIQMAAQYLVF